MPEKRRNAETREANREVKIKMANHRTRTIKMVKERRALKAKRDPRKARNPMMLRTLRPMVLLLLRPMVLLPPMVLRRPLRRPLHRLDSPRKEHPPKNPHLNLKVTELRKSKRPRKC